MLNFVNYLCKVPKAAPSCFVNQHWRSGRSTQINTCTKQHLFIVEIFLGHCPCKGDRWRWFFNSSAKLILMYWSSSIERCILQYLKAMCISENSTCMMYHSKCSCMGKQRLNPKCCSLLLVICHSLPNNPKKWVTNRYVKLHRWDTLPLTLTSNYSHFQRQWDMLMCVFKLQVVHST